MIVGRGLIATAFERCPELAGVIYAAGVSNSVNADPHEFERDWARLSDALSTYPGAPVFVYFSTCSIDDKGTLGSNYVRHKIAMEALVAAHKNYLIIRLPQVAGWSDNPHTLLNYMHGKIVRGEDFIMRAKTTRNIIDVEDVVDIVQQLVAEGTSRLTVNVANPVSHLVSEIVAAMERATGKQAVAQISGAGGNHVIDTTSIKPIIAKLGISFDAGYLDRVICKYYKGKN